ncbi:hypothetical protein M422DRAFT_264235 [Sphaerobolus stellatus SS14]|uniref:F-box domain-containing protein n=1 Tax=Sphaerobolus stellatus (strain SS14) TaxID=990650 RepID=A0A0C9V8X6_SPHS4|nr:hypothetical protein M422DRAFT_264235 [Sphaerobolus stellatus SS14]
MDMQRPRQLFDCPEEIVEFIILDIPNPSDLLHLALACKALCKRIIPYHIQFRILKLGLGYVPGWLLDILTQHASLLSRYRTAEFTIARFSEYPLCLRPTASDLLGFIDYPYLDLVDVIWQSLSLFPPYPVPPIVVDTLFDFFRIISLFSFRVIHSEGDRPIDAGMQSPSSSPTHTTHQSVLC